MIDAEFVTRTRTADETQALGRCLAGALQAGDMIALVGDLGAGKTCFVQGLAEGLQVQGRVTSPTFIVMRSHPGRLPLFHADAYRLSGPDDLLDVGLEDWLAEGVVAVEWADLAGEALPLDHLTLQITADQSTSAQPEVEPRTLTFRAHGPRSRQLVEHLRRCVC